MANRSNYRRRGKFVPLPPGVWKVSRSLDRSQWAREHASTAIQIWEHARKEQRTHAWILEQRQRLIYDRPTWRMLTAYERAEVNATFRAASDIAWRRDLTHRLGPVSGPLPEASKPNGSDLHDWSEGSPLPLLARTPGALYGGTFWRGTDSCFDTYSCSNPVREKEKVS